ncbi:MAG: 2-C-methyl-D-erythritol 2,4-cyclodiphosphate synthase, partial [Merdibacter sp.]
HAVAESILGALALGDLGSHFPDSDPRYKGACSLDLLSCVYEKMRAEGYRIGNVDALVMIERPKMAPHIEQMRGNLARCLHCGIDQISVKATRGEGLGFVGREEGVLAQSGVLLVKGEE